MSSHFQSGWLDTVPCQVQFQMIFHIIDMLNPIQSDSSCFGIGNVIYSYTYLNPTFHFILILF
jgi:hypothetical protein